MVEILVDSPMEAKVNIKRRMKDLVPTRTKREITHIVLMIKIIETKEEEENLGEDLEEEAFVEPIFNVEKEMEPMSFLNVKEGKIEYLKVTSKFPMWMKMQSLHILNMLKEERPLLSEEPF